LPEPLRGGRALQEAILTTRIGEMSSALGRVHAFVEFKVTGVDQRVMSPALRGIELPS
jgi:hypothetical protein